MLGRLTRIVVISASLCASAANLPVYIEDSHAGSFYWAIKNLSLTEGTQLVLIDAHSDSSEVFDSDSIRQKVLEAAGNGQVDGLVGRWRSKGAIQCFNWIEPLIPHPITKVWWVPAESLTAIQIAQRRREVREQINAHEITSARKDGDFSDRYEVLDLRHFMKQKIDSPVVVSIDLDYFASEKEPSKVARMLDVVLRLPHLQAITIAISRPYLASEDRAHLLFFEALHYLTQVVNVDIHYEPFVSTGEDRSQKAKEFYWKRMNVPHHEVETAPSYLRSLLLQNTSRIEVDEGRDKWEDLLNKWRGDVPRITLSGGDPNGVISAEQPFRLRLENYHALEMPQIRWKVFVAAQARYNLTNGDDSFAEGAPKFLRYEESPVDAADGLIELDGSKLTPFLDPKTGLGTLRVFCELTIGKETYVSNVVRFSRYKGDGYIGKLTEIFNLPYVYGSAMLRIDGKTSADARYGADCSHFIIYGRRREGWNVPYVNPKDLLPYLEEVDEFKSLQNGVAYGRRGPIRVTPELVRNGLLLHFGNHVAAVFEDTGILTEQTPVVHQLEGYPEITTFGAMARKYKQIRIMKFTSSSPAPYPEESRRHSHPRNECQRAHPS